MAEHSLKEVLEMRESRLRLVTNFEAHIGKSRKMSAPVTRQAAEAPGRVSFDRFEVRDKLRAIEGRAFVNPDYYDSSQEFDLRVRKH